MEDDPLSISGIVDRFGITLDVFRPTNGIAADGEVTLTFASVLQAKGFVQPSTQSSPIAQGREQGRTQTTIYFSGSVDVRIDDEIHDAASGTARTWRVVGAVNPGEVAASGAAAHLNLTAVDCIEVEPSVSV